MAKARFEEHVAFVVGCASAIDGRAMARLILRCV